MRPAPRTVICSSSHVLVRAVMVLSIFDGGVRSSRAITGVALSQRISVVTSPLAREARIELCSSNQLF